MKSGSLGRQHVVPAMYATVVVAAMLLDLLTDRSGGALSLATLVVAVIAGVCFILGQTCIKLDTKRFFAYWMIGMLLILLGLAALAIEGGDAPKDGELIYTFAMLISAPASSLLLPFVASSTSGHGFGDVMLRSAVTWSFVVACGSLQWWMVRTIVRRICAALESPWNL